MGPKQQRSKKTVKRGSRKGTSSVLNVVTPHLMVQLPYSQRNFIVEGAAGLGASYTYCLNNLFDPDFSGGGLQPLGFDQYAQFYLRYRVTSVRLEFQFANRAADPVIVGMYCSPQSTLPAVATAWVVQPTPYTKAKVLSGETGGPSVTTLSATVDIAKVFGCTKQEFKSDMDFTALFTGGPARQAYVHVFVHALAGNVASAYILSRMYYTVEFEQPVALSMS